MTDSREINVRVSFPVRSSLPPSLKRFKAGKPADGSREEPHAVRRARPTGLGGVVRRVFDRVHAQFHPTRHSFWYRLLRRSK